MSTKRARPGAVESGRCTGHKSVKVGTKMAFTALYYALEGLSTRSVLSWDVCRIVLSTIEACCGVAGFDSVKYPFIRAIAAEQAHCKQGKTADTYIYLISCI